MKVSIPFSPMKAQKNPTKRTNVLFIQKNGLICVTLPDKTVKEYIYPTEMVSDGDVINRDGLHGALLQWFSDVNSKATETYCMVGKDILFEKVVPINPKSKQPDEKEITQFTDSTPYQRISVVRISQKDGTCKILVANKDLLSVIAHSVEKAGLEVMGIYPELLAIADASENISGEPSERAKQNLTVFTLKNTTEYAFTILGDKPIHKSLTQMSVSEAAQQPVDPMVAVVIVIVLILCGAGIGYFQYTSAKQRQIALARERYKKAQLAKNATPTGVVKVSAQNETPTPTGSALPTPPAQVATQSAQLTERIIRIQITHTTDTEALYESVKETLQKNKLFQISSTLSQSAASNNRVLATNSVPADVLSEVMSAVQSAGVTIEAKQAAIDDYDVVIELNSYTPSAPNSGASTPTP